MNKRFYGGLSIKPTKGQVRKGGVVINFDVIQRMVNVYIILQVTLLCRLLYAVVLRCTTSYKKLSSEGLKKKLDIIAKYFC